MAISETSLRDILLFAFDEINKKGGVMGKKIEPVVVDGASNWPLFAEKAKQLLEQDKVAVTFGCWTSVSRKSVLPVFEKDNGLLFYPVQYEGEELSKNIFYTAEAVNQQATPGGRLPARPGQEEILPDRHRLRLPADHQPHPSRVPPAPRACRWRTSAAACARMTAGKVISAGKYVPFGYTDFQQIVADIKQFAAGGDACVINTINGDSNVPFFKEIAAAGLTPADCPVSPSASPRTNSAACPTKDLVGELGCWTYFMSLKTPENKKFLKNWNAWLSHREPSGRGEGKARGRQPDGPLLRRRLPLEGGGRKGRQLDVDKVRAVLEAGDISFDGPGGKVTDAEEPPRDQERLHRRNQGRRPVQDPQDLPARLWRALPQGHVHEGAPPQVLPHPPPRQA